jgi:hypothetical protein
MKIADVHDFESLSQGRSFPGFIWSTRNDLLDLLGGISKLILFGAEMKFWTDHVRVGELAPERVDNRFGHFSDCTSAYVFGLKVFFDAVGGSNLVADL